MSLVRFPRIIAAMHVALPSGKRGRAEAVRVLVQPGHSILCRPGVFRCKLTLSCPRFEGKISLR